ncbi:glycosyltransferase [Amnibacterium flavum]|uniref:Glycosyl transferase family 28 C-terminal domain-containing protein n=1 Tax=Amnibacterium flavum TaxID=2173173 RepID=A0A2V1HS12_9MICO|nr:glycosyltransferase [Amnibacterium flavum]PVZ95348.1 hypothetical protein DDQ50_02175 [Amnibacterium flavum]
MIGYYVHHRGSGHRHRALAIARELDTPVTGLSSALAPVGWTGEWIELAPDTGPETVHPVDPRAGGRLHWVPRGGTGLLARMAAISAWFVAARPEAVVVDVSVEVALLARLHGIPVVTIGQPGDRRDPAHRLGYDISEAIIAPWPAGLDPLIVDEPNTAKIRPVGTIARIASTDATSARRGGVALLRGHGAFGTDPLSLAADSLRRSGIPVTEITGSVEQISHSLRDATVVISHCGQNAVAEIAATRTPALLIADDRPHDEQRHLARALERFGVPAVVVAEAPSPDRDWAADIERARRFDGIGWNRFTSGDGAAAAAAIISEVAFAGREAAI